MLSRDTLLQPIVLRSYSSFSCTHSHDYYQWVLPLSGTLELTVANQGGLVDSNHGALIVPQESHSFASNDDNQFVVLNIQDKHAWMNNTEISCFWDIPIALKKFLPFAQHYLGQKNSSTTMLYNFFNQLLMEHFLSVSDKVILKALNWLDLHFAEPINLQKIASFCCLSVSQLQRRFKRVLGKGIAEYWRIKRLQRAKILLEQNITSIESIAHSIGYENLPAFSRSFTREFDLSPREWRDMTFGAKNMHLNDKA